jgi:hypothetical protein
LTHEHAQISVEEPVEGVARRETVSLPGSSLLWMGFSDLAAYHRLNALERPVELRRNWAVAKHPGSYRKNNFVRAKPLLRRLLSEETEREMWMTSDHF